MFGEGQSWNRQASFRILQGHLVLNLNSQHDFALRIQRPDIGPLQVRVFVDSPDPRGELVTSPAAEPFSDNVGGLFVDWITRGLHETPHRFGVAGPSEMNTVGALRQLGLFDVSVRLSDEGSDYADLLTGKVPEDNAEPFDLILLLPRGLDTKTNVSIWLVSAGLSELEPFVRGAVNLVSQIVDQVFVGSGHAIDVTEDLWPGFLWAVYVTKGWM